jgi:hypothetical protein
VLLLCLPDAGAAASAAASLAAAALLLPLLISTRLSVLPLPLLLLLVVACVLNRRQLYNPALSADVGHLMLTFSKLEMDSTVLLRSIRPSSAFLRQFNCVMAGA